MNGSYVLTRCVFPFLTLGLMAAFSLAVGREVVAGKWPLMLAVSLVLVVTALASTQPTVALIALVAGLFTAFLDLPEIGVATLTLSDALIVAGIVASVGSRTWQLVTGILRIERTFTVGLALL